VEVIDGLPIPVGSFPTVGDLPPMNRSTSDELLGALAELRALFPDWRFGQLVANVTTVAGATEAGAIWDIQDEALLTAARRLIDRNRGRKAVRA
jgi:hypothetical protein